MRSLNKKPKLDLREGILFVDGEQRGFNQRQVLELRGDKFTILDTPQELASRDLHFLVDQIIGLDVAKDFRCRRGKASLKNGWLGIIGNRSHNSSKVNFQLFPPLNAWPE